jgi:hypothetical protein
VRASNALDARVLGLCTVIASSTLCGAAAADDADDREHVVVVGVGGASELEVTGGSVHVGANVMVEWEAVENWLELEVGVSALATASGVDVPVDVLFKKPFRLTPVVELMVGAGPEMIWVGDERRAHFGAEVALDIMFWPWNRRVGLWVEPECDLIANGGVSPGIGATGGVLLGW